eukprot:TRINITY_DN18384_c0_g1_i1.p1 TRINITY_DN18384_c0_g1~~TRINITY_DN18384_c0_g1_i1.p1  ORF type:complete len:171 (-),score=26.31 TRINITY_DN18384_c0_g1_i1:51-563(-)
MFQGRLASIFFRGQNSSSGIFRMCNFPRRWRSSATDQLETIDQLRELQKRALSWRIPRTSLRIPRIVWLNGLLAVVGFGSDWYMMQTAPDESIADKHSSLATRRRTYELSAENVASYVLIAGSTGFCWAGLRSLLFLRKLPQFKPLAFFGLFKEPLTKEFIKLNAMLRAT